MIKEQLNKIVQMAEKYQTKSIAKISDLLNMHRDTVKRRLKTLRTREYHPCSSAFETAAGQQWLQLLLVLWGSGE
jgi:IS30 family transposase